mmetsp:Transcript_25398/g.82139  ORF Transcript_25398/g.82139 Transcript_25398/m.82139 type:complete len:408 (-) Transcript_25398:953-2176(-)
MAAPFQKTILLCGGGNATHVMTALFGSAGHRVRILSTFGDEAERLEASQGITCRCDDGTERTGRPEKVSKRPEDVVPGCEYVILAVPAFAHESYLALIEPYVSSTLTVGAFPGQGGFDTCVRSALRGKDCVVFAGETLPWACRIVDFGKRVDVLGTKKEVDVAVSPVHRTEATLEALQDLLGPEPRLCAVGSFLSVTLMNINQIWHPTISYGRFKDWDGTPFEAPPPFYEGVDDFTAKMLTAMSDEILHVKRVVNDKYPDVDLGGVVHVREWITRAYGDDIKDPSNLMTSINTNKGYQGLTHPCVEAKEKTQQGLPGFLPDFRYRYFTEDVPFGLLVSKGIAELAHVKTPAIDTVIDWCQSKLGRQYLTATDDGLTLQGATDLDKSRAPQRYGFHDLHSYMVAHKYA